MLRRNSLSMFLLATLVGCATAPEPEDTAVPSVTRANGLLRLTRTEVDALLATRRATFTTPSGKAVVRRGASYRLTWTEHAVPVVAGRQRVGQIDRYDGDAEIGRNDLEGLRKLMDEARIRAKGVRVPDDLASPTLVRCDPRQCAVDLPIEATATGAPPMATFLRKALAAQPVEAATSAVH